MKKKGKTKRKQTKKRTKKNYKNVSKATKADKRRQEQWPILALPDGRIVAKYDLLIGTWRTAI